eukprot:Awhi_evm1s2493
MESPNPTISVEVFHCKNVSMKKKKELFLKISFGKRKFRTKTVNYFKDGENTLLFNEQCEFLVLSSSSSSSASNSDLPKNLQFDLCEDGGFISRSLGTTTLPLRSLTKEGGKRWYDLQDKKQADIVIGELMLSCRISEPLSFPQLPKSSAAQLSSSRLNINSLNSKRGSSENISVKSFDSNNHRLESNNSAIISTPSSKSSSTVDEPVFKHHDNQLSISDDDDDYNKKKKNDNSNNLNKNKQTNKSLLKKSLSYQGEDNGAKNDSFNSAKQRRVDKSKKVPFEVLEIPIAT